MAKNPSGFSNQYGYTDDTGNFVPDQISGYGTQGFDQAWNKYLNLQRQSNQYNPDVATKELANYADIFKQHFKDYAGRDPNADEYSRFWQEVVAPQGSYPGGKYAGIPELIDRTNNLIRNDLAGEISQGKQSDAQAKIPSYTGQLNSVFNATLGRDATQDEVDHFGKMFASGDADSYTLAQALQQLPEYQNAQNQKNRDALSGELKKADTDYFNQNLMPTIQQNFAQQGRVVGPESQTLANALVSAGNQQNVAREQYLAQLGASDYANTRQNTINQYLAQQQRNWQLQDQSTARNYQLSDQAYTRANDVTDYDRQMAAYQDYLSRMGRRQSSGFGSGIGTLVGAGLGVAAAPFTGGLSLAAVGAGAGLGGISGGLFDKY